MSGSVELDDAYLGDERSGGKRGRGAEGKTPFVAAVETNDEGHPPCFNAVTEVGYLHEKIVCGSGKSSVKEPKFCWLNTIPGNLKSAFRSTYHAVRHKYARRYLSDFRYRFNRRFDLRGMIPRLIYVALRTPPMPGRLLKVGLA